MAENKPFNWTPWVVTGAIILVIISAFSFFITNNFFNADRFAEKTSQGITSEPSRDAIASVVTSELLAEEPLIVQGLISQPTERLISGVLNTDISQSIFFGVAYGLNRILVSNDLEPVTINISSIAQTIESVADAVAPENELDASQYQDKEIVLFENSDILNVKWIGQTASILGPLALAGIAVIAITTWIKLPEKLEFLKYSASVLTISGAILLLITYMIGLIISVNVASPELSTIIGEIYNSLASSFRWFNFFMILVGAALGYIYYAQINDISFNIKSQKS